MRAEGRAAGWLVVCAAVAVHLPALDASFQFDDWNVIVANRLVHSWSAWWSGMPGIRPLLKASYTLSWTAGFGVTGFRAFNIAVHALNALLVLHLVRRIAPRLGVADAPTAALVAALVFALHPAQTEAVTYVSGRSSALMSTFCLLAVLAHLRAADARAPGAWRGLSGLALLAALGVKENAWAVPGLLLLCEASDRDFRWRVAFARLWSQWLVLGAACVLVLFIPAYWRLFGASLATRSLGDNLLTQIDGVFHLLSGPLWGIGLNIDPDLAARVAWSPELGLKAGVLAALLAVVIAQWRARPWLAFGIAWWFVALLPTNSVLPRLDVVNDRQLYLALVGPAIVVGHAVGTLSGRAGLTAIVVLAILLGGRTMMRNADYQTEVALWESTARGSPGKARVWNNLGHAYEQAGRRDDAVRAYDRAIELDPDFWKARLNRDALE